MLERLKKCMTPGEIYFCKRMLKSGQPQLKLKMKDVAISWGLSQGTIHDALRILEVAGYIKTTKIPNYTKVTFVRRNLIERLTEEYKK